MRRSFMADIHLKAEKDCENIVSIIPFYDNDKTLAKILEKTLNDSLKYDNDIDWSSHIGNVRVMKENF